MYSIGYCEDNSLQALKDFEAHLKRAHTYSPSEKIKLQLSGASNVSAKELLYSENEKTEVKDFVRFINAQYRNYFNNNEAPDLIVIKQE